MRSHGVGSVGERRDGSEARRAYEPPSLVVLGTVQELTLAGVSGQSDGAGFEELGGS